MVKPLNGITVGKASAMTALNSTQHKKRRTNTINSPLLLQAQLQNEAVYVGKFICYISQIERNSSKNTKLLQTEVLRFTETSCGPFTKAIHGWKFNQRPGSRNRIPSVAVISICKLTVFSSNAWFKTKNQKKKKNQLLESIYKPVYHLENQHDQHRKLNERTNS